MPSCRCATIELRGRFSDLPFLHAAVVALLDATGLSALARRLGDWGMVAGGRAVQS